MSSLQQVNIFYLKFIGKLNINLKLVSGFVCSGSQKDQQTLLSDYKFKECSLK